MIIVIDLTLYLTLYYCTCTLLTAHPIKNSWHDNKYIKLRLTERCSEHKWKIWLSETPPLCNNWYPMWGTGLCLAVFLLMLVYESARSVQKKWIPLGIGISTEFRDDCWVAMMSSFPNTCCIGWFGDTFLSRLPMFDVDVLDWQMAFMEVCWLYLEEIAGFMCWTVDYSRNLLLAHTEALCTRVGGSGRISVLVPGDL